MTAVTNMTPTQSISSGKKKGDVKGNVKKTLTGMKKKAFGDITTTTTTSGGTRQSKPSTNIKSNGCNSSQDSGAVDEAIELINDSNKEEEDEKPTKPNHHRRTSSSSSYRLTSSSRGGGSSSVNLQTESSSDSSSGSILTRGHGSSVSLRMDSDLDPRAASELLLDNSDRLSQLVYNSHTNLAGLVADFSSSSSESDCEELFTIESSIF
ncbi:unnamed protein product [Cylindrotheca closterium]|uniref:Uncharacterized protein n=1 Tax=Cylindrotheca closterium TaxID=2856 RepID=A0AAD2PWP4_9STRA|nr:unnamed protein product [Cylindrotheca closterium]